MATGEPTPDAVDDELTERAARAFHEYLRRRYPGVTWVRVRKGERPDPSAVQPPRKSDGPAQ